MSWVRVDDEFADHPKVAPLSDQALRLWLEASCWSRKPGNLKHEGRIPDALLVTIAKNRYPRAKALKLAAELVAADGGGLYEQGLWLVVDGGWQIHDWQVYGFVEQDPDSLSAKRSEAGRKGAVARWQKDSKQQFGISEANGEDMPPVPDPKPDPRRPETTTQDLTGHGDAEPPAGGGGSEPKIRCPADLRLTEDQAAMLESALFSRDRQAATTQRFVAAELADPRKTMTLTQWRKCLSMACSAALNNRDIDRPRGGSRGGQLAPRQPDSGFSAVANAKRLE